jgi:hypothetical protein
MGNPPTEPSADLRQFASLLWQMYTALKAEGFSERQAFGILGQAITTAIQASIQGKPNEE